ncbi:hypothetical protein LJB86_04935 [Deltaproteobacteria bacterium OttesenSCG-928-M10]|nr:hypothetical protein [Deltaproteobacteria bacterium OttesenSCG-928-M10]
MFKAALRFLLYIPLGLFMTILNYPLAPFVVLAARPDGFLPRSLRIFQTPDNSLDGDYGWQTEHRLFRSSPKVDQGWRRWVNRFLWLWRNPCHGFKIEYLGFGLKPGFVYAALGDEATTNRPLHNGLVFRRVANPGGPAAFQLYIVRAWSKKYCLRLNLGWKIWQSPAAGSSLQYVCSVNPFMGYGG